MNRWTRISLLIVFTLIFGIIAFSMNRVLESGLIMKCMNLFIRQKVLSLHLLCLVRQN